MEDRGAHTDTLLKANIILLIDSFFSFCLSISLYFAPHSVTPGNQDIQLLSGDRMRPHVRVHGRRADNWL